MKNFVCITEPSVFTVPFATSKPRSFSAFICSIKSRLHVTSQEVIFEKTRKVNKDVIIKKSGLTCTKAFNVAHLVTVRYLSSKKSNLNTVNMKELFDCLASKKSRAVGERNSETQRPIYWSEIDN